MILVYSNTYYNNGNTTNQVYLIWACFEAAGPRFESISYYIIGNSGII